MGASLESGWAAAANLQASKFEMIWILIPIIQSYKQKLKCGVDYKTIKEAKAKKILADVMHEILEPCG